MRKILPAVKQFITQTAVHTAERSAVPNQTAR